MRAGSPPSPPVSVVVPNRRHTNKPPRARHAHAYQSGRQHRGNGALDSKVGIRVEASIVGRPDFSEAKNARRPSSSVTVMIDNQTVRSKGRFRVTGETRVATQRDGARQATHITCIAPPKKAGLSVPLRHMSWNDLQDRVSFRRRVRQRMPAASTHELGRPTYLTLTQRSVSLSLRKRLQSMQDRTIPSAVRGLRALTEWSHCEHSRR